jgi:hypothetical protein
MELLLREWLSGGPVASDEIITRTKDVGISVRTLKIAKQRIEVKSVKIGEKWFAALPG